MSDKIFDKLSMLHGTWKGKGFAQYPTIESTEYEEVLKFEFDSDYPIIHFEQKVILVPGNSASHWESGFIKETDEGEILMSNAQNNGRTEVLKGKINSEKLNINILEIEFNSIAFANDSRMIKSKRIFTVNVNKLHYVKFMSTTLTEKPQMLKHIEANLVKVG